MDISTGRFVVFSATGNRIGLIDGDEFVRDGLELLFRIDGGVAYSRAGSRILGFLNDAGQIMTSGGEVLYVVKPE